MPRLILASSSPRRVELLEEAGYGFEAVSPNVDESQRPGETPWDFAIRIAAAKALRVLDDDAVTLGADTVVVHDGKALGKPANAEEAAAVLQMLSGKSHEVLTGWALAEPRGLIESGVESTVIEFRDLSDRDIDSYVASGEPLDRAGSYAIQGGAAGFVASIDGSYTNVMGLAMEAVTAALARAGVIPEPKDGTAP